MYCFCRKPGASSILVIACALGLAVMSTPALAQDTDPHKTGMRPPTAKEREWMDKHVLRVTKVKLNRIGLDRVNQHLEKRGLRSAVEAPVEVGAELEGYVGAVSGSGTAPVAASPDLSGANLGAGIATALPASVDNSALKYFPPIKSQGVLSSCAQFSSVYYTLTHMTAMARDLDAKNGGGEFRFAPNFTYNMVNGGNDTGSWWAWDILINNGCIRWCYLPYTTDYKGWCLNAAAWRDAINYRADKAFSIGGLDATDHSNALNQVKTLLSNGYILNYATYFYGWQYKTVVNDPTTTNDDPYVGGVIAYNLNDMSGAHAGTLVGYNDDIWCDVNGNGVVDPGEKGAFRMANSWGPGWGNGGFAWVTYDSLRTTSIVPGAPARTSPMFWYGEVQGVTVRASYTPRMLTKITLNHQYRDQVLASAGIVAGGEETSLNSCLQNQGGPYAFDGSETPVDGTFYFDISDVAPSTLSTLVTYFSRLTDSGESGALLVKACSVIDVAKGVETSVTGVPLTIDGRSRRLDIKYKQAALLGNGGRP